MERVTQLITRLQQICTSLGETAMSQNAVLWNKLSTIVVVGGQVRDRCCCRLPDQPQGLGPG